MEKVLPESVPTPHLSGPLSLHELQRLFEQAPVWHYSVFDREFRCRGVNASFAERSGLPRRTTSARRCLKSVRPRPPLACWLQQLRHGAAQTGVELDDMEGHPFRAAETVGA